MFRDLLLSLPLRRDNRLDTGVTFNWLDIPLPWTPHMGVSEDLLGSPSRPVGVLGTPYT